MSKINAFDVFSRMVETDDKAFQLAPFNNIVNLRKVKAGTEVTIGVGGDIVGSIYRDFVGGFILVKKERYQQLRAEMEKEVAESTEGERK